MKILVCGGRDFNDWNFFLDNLARIIWELGWTHPRDAMSPHRDVEIISGMARGADILAVKYASLYNLKVLEFPADWKKYGPAAGPIRNQQMLDEGRPDLVIAFPGGKGTADMINRAKKAGVEVIKIEYK